EIASVMNLRNAVDELERQAEPARTLFGEKCFAGLRSVDLEPIRLRLESLAAAKVRSFRDSITGDRGRSKRIAELAAELAPDAELLGSTVSIDSLEEFERTLAERLEWACRVQ